MIPPVVQKLGAVVSMRSHLTIAALLVPLYAALGICIYWLYFDNAPPLIITYSHPYFLSGPAATRDDARRLQITEALGGNSVWTYREVCRMRGLPGHVVTRWDANGFSWTVPEDSFPAPPNGCLAASYEVTLPTSNPTRDVRYVSERHYQINPLRDEIVPAPDIPIRILANK